jgi:hypothetical protein
VGVVAPDGNSIKAQTKPVLEVRDYRDGSGNTVDCTGTADSSAAMNSLTATQDVSTEKTISTRGCPKIRLDSQWLIHAQLGLEIDLGGTMYSGGAVQGGTLIFGCNGSAGALIRIGRSGYVYLHGGTIEAKGPSCASNFTGSIVTTNNGSGGYTQTRNKFSDLFLTTNVGGTGMSGYFGFRMEGTPNQEGYGLHHVYINCFNSSGSYGFWSTAGNADSTVIDNQSLISSCYEGVRMESGLLYIYNSHISGNGGYSTYGAGGATFAEAGNGCIMALQGVVVAENSGQLFNSNNDGVDNCGNSRVWVANQFSFDDIDPAAYPVNINSGRLYFSSNWFRTLKALSAIHNGVLIGTDLTSAWGARIIDGGNNTATAQGGAVIPFKVIPTTANYNYSWISATDRTSGFSLRPQIYYASSNGVGKPSPTVTLQTAEWNGSTSVLGGFTWGVTSRANVGLGHTLAYVYTSPPGLNGKAAIALGAPVSGLQTVAVATPNIPTTSVIQSGTPGSTSYSYKVVAGAGYETSAASAVASTTTGNATLSGNDCNIILWNDAGSQTGMGAWGFDIYRTASGGTPSTTGLIATVSALDAAAAATAAYQGVEYQASDCGLDGGGSTPPTSSTADGSINIPAGATYKRNGTPLAASDLSNGTVGSGSIVLASGVLGTGPAVLATGNVATATTLAATPSQCSTHNFATGVTAGGNANCAQPAAADINGLGGAATLNVGTTSGTVAAGDDSRFNCDVTKNPCRVAATSLTGQTASIGNTTLYTPSVAGQYRVVLSLWTMVAGSSGTVSFSLSANTGSGAESFGSASLDLTKVNSGGQVSGQWNMHVDANQPISYNTTLTCSSCGSPQYGIDVMVERLQ